MKTKKKPGSFLAVLFILLVSCGHCSLAGTESLDQAILKVQSLNLAGRYEDGLKLLKSVEGRFILSYRKAQYYILRQRILLLENRPYQEKMMQEAKAMIRLLETTPDSSFLSHGQSEMDFFVLGLSHLKNKLSLIQKTSYSSMLLASQRAFKTWGNKKHECYWTAVSTAKHNGSMAQTHWQWKSDLSYRRKSLAKIPEAIEKGVLKPGMVVYANRRPGTDPKSSNLSNKPHWFTFLGYNEKGQPMFSDQYFVATDFSKMKTWIAGRLIDSFYDPYDR
ncbi:MAG: hypothetical protein H3C47_06760 [Candidatus Cloacimonetes bacterium]|nr:hypothetical protein [Candidatus Cloacimonadota bacterium]